MIISRSIYFVMLAVFSMQLSFAQTPKSYSGFLSEYWGVNLDSTSSLVFAGMKPDHSSRVADFQNSLSQVGKDRGLNSPEIYYKRSTHRYKFSGHEQEVELSLIGSNFYGPNNLAPDSASYLFYRWETPNNLTCAEFDFFIKTFSEKYGNFQKKIYKSEGYPDNLVRLSKVLGDVEILIGFPEYTKKDLASNNSKCICSGMCNSNDGPYNPYGISVTNRRIIDSLSVISNRIEQDKREITKKAGSKL